MTQCYISYVALRLLHRMQNAPWALLADHQIGVLHKCALMCFSWKDNYVASGTWAARETETVNYQWLFLPAGPPFFRSYSVDLTRYFSLIPRERGSVLSSYESDSSDSSAYCSTSKLVQLLQRKTLSSLKLHISPSPLSFSGRRLGWRQGEIMLGLRQGLELHEHFSNSLDPELAIALKSPLHMWPCLDLKKMISDLLADQSYLNPSKLLQNYWKEPFLINLLLWLLNKYIKEFFLSFLPSSLPQWQHAINLFCINSRLVFQVWNLQIS